MNDFNDSDKNYDLIIVGTGPAGLTAGLFASRYKMKTLAIGQIDGGLMLESHKICNFPTEQDITGFDLMKKMKANAVEQGTKLENGEVVDIQKDKNGFTIILVSEKKYFSKAVLLAMGTAHRKLGLENEESLLGHGVSYCATCDGMFYKNKTVAVIGGNDSALTAALYLAKVASKVYLIYHEKQLRGEPIWIEKIAQYPNIEILLKTNVKSFLGQEKIEGVQLDKFYKDKDSISLDGIFIEIGTEPKHFDYIDNLEINTNEKNYIQVNNGQRTSCLGVWAAGDITTASNGFRQVITACAEGAIAVENIFRYVQSL